MVNIPEQSSDALANGIHELLTSSGGALEAVILFQEDAVGLLIAAMDGNEAAVATFNAINQVLEANSRPGTEHLCLTCDQPVRLIADNAGIPGFFRAQNPTAVVSRAIGFVICQTCAERGRPAVHAAVHRAAEKLSPGSRVVTVTHQEDERSRH